MDKLRIAGTQQQAILVRWRGIFAAQKQIIGTFLSSLGALVEKSWERSPRREKRARYVAKKSGQLFQLRSWPSFSEMRSWKSVRGRGGGGEYCTGLEEVRAFVSRDPKLDFHDQPMTHRNVRVTEIQQ